MFKGVRKWKKNHYLFFSDILRILDLSSVDELWSPDSDEELQAKIKELELFLSEYCGEKEAKMRAKKIINMALIGELSIECLSYP